VFLTPSTVTGATVAAVVALATTGQAADDAA